MKYILNLKSFTFIYFAIIVLFVGFNIIHINIIDEYFGKEFFKNDIKNIALANIGIFASLTGFLIASIPFLVSIIIKENYLINAVKNNLNEITIALKTIFVLFILSLFILFINFEQSHFFIQIGVVSILIYLYIVLLYYIYEIIELLHIFVGDLKNLKKNMSKPETKDSNEL
jgi:hypothetical protein